MRRVLLLPKRRHIGFPRWCSTDSILDDIFSELSACDITQRSNKPKSSNPSGLESSAFASVSADADKDEAEVRAEVAKQERLERLVQEAKGQATTADAEAAREAAARRHREYTASPPAMLRLSTAELIQEKGPQHFTPAKDSAEQISALPRVQSPGSVAVVTLVGKVLEGASMHGGDADTGEVNSIDGVRHARLLVEYSVPFIPNALTTAVQVRCYGATLSGFAERHVKVGDLVHVLGHLLPLDGSPSGGPACCVCALPVGGNISVVLSAELEAL